MASVDFQRKLGMNRDNLAQEGVQITADSLPLDPRPELINDSTLWTDLLKQTFAEDPDGLSSGLFGALHDLRNQGAKITKDDKFGLKLTQGEIEETKWNHYRELLKPWGKELTGKLRTMAVARSVPISS